MNDVHNEYISLHCGGKGASSINFCKIINKKDNMQILFFFGAFFGVFGV